MNKVYLLTGGNLGNRQENLERALHLVAHNCGTVLAKSGLYETAAWGNRDQPAFLNQVACMDTLLPANDLLSCLLQIETLMGRTRQTRWEPRIIDIDLLFFNDEIITTPQLTVPHPEIPNRRFVLEPLCEIAAGLQHPVLQENMLTLLKRCTDPLSVKKIH